MTSNITYQGINEFFPVAGEDNDTQGFRDNFDTIKRGLQAANQEVSDLLTNAARTDSDTDYNLHKIKNAVLENVRTQKVLGFNNNNTNISPTSIDFSLGSYQIFKVASGNNLEPFVFDIVNFPGDPALFGSANIGVGRAVVELYSDGQQRTVSFRTTGTTVIKKNNFPAVPPGNVGDLIVRSSANPVFVEIWRHSQGTIFIKYLGYMDQANSESFSGGAGFGGFDIESAAAKEPVVLEKIGNPVKLSGQNRVDFSVTETDVQKITVLFDNVKTNSTEGILIQLGSEDAGYTSVSSTIQPQPVITSSADGFQLHVNNTRSELTGSITLQCIDLSSNTWIANGNLLDGSENVIQMITGRKSLSKGKLEGICITTVNGKNTFNAGTINIVTK